MLSGLICIQYFLFLQLNLQAIRNAKTVIEIWDDDFGKDQFLCGVRFFNSFVCMCVGVWGCVCVCQLQYLQYTQEGGVWKFFLIGQNRSTNLR